MNLDLAWLGFWVFAAVVFITSYLHYTRSRHYEAFLLGREDVIALTPAEIQSGHTRVDWAESLILQLPEDHDGRNSWLLNYGTRSGVRLCCSCARRYPNSLEACPYCSTANGAMTS